MLAAALFLFITLRKWPVNKQKNKSKNGTELDLGSSSEAN